MDKEKTLDQINKKLEEQNSQLLNQTKIYENQVKLLNEKYAIAESLVVKNEELYKTKESALQKDLDEARKPRWGAMGGSLGLGAILTLIAVLLL